MNKHVYDMFGIYPTGIICRYKFIAAFDKHTLTTSSSGKSSSSSDNRSRSSSDKSGSSIRSNKII